MTERKKIPLKWTVAAVIASAALSVGLDRWVSSATDERKAAEQLAAIALAKEICFDEAVLAGNMVAELDDLLATAGGAESMPVEFIQNLALENVRTPAELRQHYAGQLTKLLAGCEVDGYKPPDLRAEHDHLTGQ